MNFKRGADYDETKIDELIDWVSTLKIPAETEVLRTLQQLKPYARMRPLEELPETSLFVVLSRAGYLDEPEELCLEGD